MQNEFPKVTSKEERREKLLKRMHQIFASSIKGKNGKGFNLEDNPWTKQADKDSESHAAKLRSMVAPKVFEQLFLGAETQSMLANYKGGTTQVSNVALLSARAVLMDVEDHGDNNNASSSETITPNEEVDDKSTTGEVDDAETSVADNSTDNEVKEAADTTKLEASHEVSKLCLLYTSPSPRDQRGSRMPSSA